MSVSVSRINTLQMGRGLASLAVLLFHTNGTLHLPKYLNQDILPIFNAGDSGVYFFFVLSGFVIFLSHEKDLGHPAQVLPFCRKRIRRVYPVLWVLLLLLIPVASAVKPGSLGDLWTVVSAFLITPARTEKFLLPVEWTLRREILFYCIFTLAVWRVRLGLAVVVVWLIFSAILSFDQAALYPWTFLFSHYNLMFAFGVAACVVFTRGIELPAGALLVTGLCIFTALWSARIMESAQPLMGFSPVSILAELGFAFAATLIIISLAILERANRIRVPGFLIFLGEASYSVYLIHFPVVSLMSKLVTLMGTRFGSPATLSFAVTAGTALAAGIGFHLFVEKPLQRVTARL